MKGARIAYEPEELAFIERHRTLPRAEAHAMFCARFMRSDVSFDNFKALCTRKGWKTGRTGRLEKGNIPHNKGRRGYCAPGSEKGHFPKGNRPHTWRGAGHERIDRREGYVVMIVDEPNPWTGAATRPVFKHRWLWEQQSGPLPEGHVLKCLGEKSNPDPSNWVAIPRAMLPRLNGRFGRDFDNAPPELKQTILKIARLEHEAREANRKKKDKQK